MIRVEVQMFAESLGQIWEERWIPDRGAKGGRTDLKQHQVEDNNLDNQDSKLITLP